MYGNLVTFQYFFNLIVKFQFPRIFKLFGLLLAACNFGCSQDMAMSFESKAFRMKLNYFFTNFRSIAPFIKQIWAPENPKITPKGQIFKFPKRAKFQLLETQINLVV